MGKTHPNQRPIQQNREVPPMRERELIGESKYLPEGRECPDIHRTPTQKVMTLGVTL